MSHKLGSASYRKRFILCVLKAEDGAKNMNMIKKFMFCLAQKHPEIFMRTVEDCFGKSTSNVASSDDEEILSFCRSGQHINGIKHRREVTREGLREAKNYVVELCKKNGVDCPFSYTS